MNTELLNMAKTFDTETKKMFTSCKFAALNVYGPRQNWEAWGDFTSEKQAIEAGKMWARAFRKGVKFEVNGRVYRVIASV